MKRLLLSALTLAGLALPVAPALAHDRDRDYRHYGHERVRCECRHYPAECREYERCHVRLIRDHHGCWIEQRYCR